MTHEQRLDRLERIATLFVKAGLRARSESREQAERINMLLNVQIRNDEKFADHEDKFGKHDEMLNMLINRQIRNDDNFAEHEKKFANLIEVHRENEERFAKLAESHANTDRQLTSLIEAVRKDRNGNSSAKS